MTSRPIRRLLLLASALTAPALASPLAAQETADAREQDDATIIVTAQRANQTGVRQGGSAGVLGDKPAEDLPFSVRSYNSALILNQQPQTLGQVLENDPTIRTTTGFGIAGELFNIRGFALAGDDVGYDWEGPETYPVFENCGLALGDILDSETFPVVLPRN